MRILFTLLLLMSTVVYGEEEMLTFQSSDSVNPILTMPDFEWYYVYHEKDDLELDSELFRYNIKAKTLVIDSDKIEREYCEDGKVIIEFRKDNENP